MSKSFLGFKNVDARQALTSSKTPGIVAIATASVGKAHLSEWTI